MHGKARNICYTGRASGNGQVPVYLFQKPNETRDWEWMVYSPQPKKRLNYTVCPGLETVKPPSTFDIPRSTL